MSFCCIRRIQQVTFGVFSICAEMLSAYFLNMFKNFLRIILKQFSVLHTTLNPSYFPYELKYFSHTLQIRLNTSQYSPCKLKFFLRILCIRRKKWEYTERNFHFQSKPDSFKGTVIEKIYFFIFSFKKQLSALHGEYAKRRKLQSIVNF